MDGRRMRVRLEEGVHRGTGEVDMAQRFVVSHPYWPISGVVTSVAVLTPER